MRLARRQMMLAGLAFGLGALALPRLPRARAAIMPGGGTFDQTHALQEAIDRAARTGVPLFLPAGTYATGTLTLQSGTRIAGVAGQTILRHRGGGSLMRVEQAEDVRLAGLALDGDDQLLGMDDALLTADDVSGLDIHACRFTASSKDGIAMQCVSGRIAGCTMSRIGGTAVASVECSDFAIVNNRIEDAATGLRLSGAPDNSSVVVRGNIISGLFLRKTRPHSGVGIVADGGAVISRNIIDGAPAYGILIDGGRPESSVAGNTIRNAYSDIGISTVPAEAIAS